MESKENMLDQMIHTCTQQLRSLTEDKENAKYPFKLLMDFVLLNTTVEVNGPDFACNRALNILPVNIC